jgi:hypothetical protein
METQGVEEMIGIAWQLSQWRVYEVSLPGRTDRTRHFAGYSLALRVPKISGPIAQFDPAKKRGADESDNVFALIGVSRDSTDVEHAWALWVKQTGATVVRDVSKEVTRTLVLYPDAQPFDWRQHMRANTGYETH